MSDPAVFQILDAELSRSESVMERQSSRDRITWLWRINFFFRNVNF